MLGATLLAVTIAAPAHHDCPTIDGDLVLVGFVASSTHALAAIAPDNALVKRAPRVDELFEVFAVEATTATGAFAAHQKGTLRCHPARTVAAEDLRSAATGKAAFDPVYLPSLVVARGAPSAPEESQEALIAQTFDVASLNDPGDHVLPVRARPARPTAIRGGTALCSQLHTPLWPNLKPVCGLLLRPSRQVELPKAEALPLALDPGAIRDELDNREGSLQPGAAFQFSQSGWGGVDLQLEAAPGEVPDPGRSWKKALLAHGVAVGLSGLSVVLSFAGKANCVTWCDDAGPLPGDGAYLNRFRRRSVASIETSGRIVRGLDFAAIGVGLLSTLIPSSRRGNLSRLEILEDALIISEGVVVSWTTPLTVQRRLGRAQPRRLHGGFTLNDEHDLVAPPLQAIRVNRASAIWGAATLLLFLEDAAPAWTFITGATLGALTLGVGVSEVRAGYAFPWDVPLSIITGLINGAGTVMWHQIFWPGWPGDERGNAPLRIRGVNVQTTAEQTQLSLAFSF